MTGNTGGWFNVALAQPQTVASSVVAQPHMEAVASGNGTASTGGTVSQHPQPQTGAVDAQPQLGTVGAQPQAGVVAHAGAAIAGVGIACTPGVPIVSGGLQRRSKLGLNA